MTMDTGNRAAADFSAANQHGESIRLSELRPTPVLMVFFPYAFTGICTGELTAVQENLSRFAAHTVRVLGCSTDSMYALRTFADAERIGYDLITDHWPHGAIASAYGAFDANRGCAQRASFLIDAARIIRWSDRTELGQPRDVAAALAAVDRLGR